MPGKKAPGRFTLQFNMDDPQQREVTEFLDRQGRRKVQLITNAVLHYLSCDRSTSVVARQEVSDEALETRMRRIFSRMLNQGDIGTVAVEASAPNRSPQPHDGYRDSINSESQKSVDYSAIERTMMAFDEQ